MLNVASNRPANKLALINKPNMYQLLRFSMQPTKKPFFQSMDKLKGLLNNQSQTFCVAALNFDQIQEFQKQSGVGTGNFSLSRLISSNVGSIKGEIQGGVGRDYSKEGGDQTQYDVVGLGEAIIDFSAIVDDSILEQFQVEKGGRRVIGAEERPEILDLLSKCKAEIEVNAGGSVANTLVEISQLSRSYAQVNRGSSHNNNNNLNVAFTGRIGDDAHGMFFQRSLSKHGVNNLTSPAPNTGTGMVIVLTSPDAQRTFLALPGNCQFKVDNATRAKIANSQMMVIEGYLIEQENALEELIDVVKFANSQGVRVVLCAGDAGLVSRNRTAFQRLINVGVDAFLGNVNEGNAYFDDTKLSGEDLSLKLAACCSIAVITDGKQGSYIGALGQVHKVEPFLLNRPAVDTTGAGDAYAAGVLFGLTQNFTREEMGALGSRLATEVIMHTSSRTDQQQVDKVISDFQSTQDMLLAADQPAYI